MNYTREAFADWLRTLPPDEPFCPPYSCPIAQSPLTLPTGQRNGAAIDADAKLVARIDALPGPWSRTTPRQILLIISELEAENANVD